MSVNAAGTDSIGSLALTVDIADSTGLIEIDSTCTARDNYLGFFELGVYGPEPVFIPATITVNPSCECPSQGDVAPLATNGDGAINILDLVFLIDYVPRSGPAPSQDAYCPAGRGDVQCDGIVNILDVTYVQNYIYGGGPAPCQPCDCDPYPGSCQ